jgi:hypothetical protein
MKTLTHPLVPCVAVLAASIEKPEACNWAI